jgi:hypothetical protein
MQIMLDWFRERYRIATSTTQLGETKWHYQTKAH